MKKIFTLLALLAFPFFTFAQIDLSNGSGLIDNAYALINLLIPFAIAVAVFIFIVGLIRYVNAGGEEDKLKAARDTIIWGIVIIFVMFSAVGLVNLLRSTFILDNNINPNDAPQILY